MVLATHGAFDPDREYVPLQQPVPLDLEMAESQSEESRPEALQSVPPQDCERCRHTFEDSSPLDDSPERLVTGPDIIEWEPRCQSTLTSWRCFVP